MTLGAAQLDSTIAWQYTSSSVASMKSHILVLYQTGRPNLEGTVKNLRERLESSTRDVVFQTGHDVSPTRILAASAFKIGRAHV